MAETESAPHKPPRPDYSDWTAAPGTESGHVAVAVSEENLAVLLGLHTGARKPETPVSANEVPATPAPQAAPEEEESPESAAAPAPATVAETVGKTLALLAAVDESRADLARPESSANTEPVPAETKPVVPKGGRIIVPRPAAPRPAATAQAAPIPPATTPAVPIPVGASTPRPRATIFSASAHQPLPVPSWAMQRPVSSSRLAAALDKLPGRWKGLLIVGVVIAAGGVSAGLLARNHRPVKPAAVAVEPPPPPALVSPSPASNFSLQLQATPEGDGSVQLRWNPQSTLIAQAREGRLVITERRQKPQTVSVPLEQLQLGYLSYRPQSEHVEFRLEVVDVSGPVAEESIVALVPKATGKLTNSAPRTPTAVTPAQPIPSVAEAAPADRPATPAEP